MADMMMMYVKNKNNEVLTVPEEYEAAARANGYTLDATEEEANATAKFRAAASQKDCHYEKRGDKYVVYRSEDRKVQKSLSYFAPNLRQFFTEEELKNVK